MLMCHVPYTLYGRIPVQHVRILLFLWSFFGRARACSVHLPVHRRSLGVVRRPHPEVQAAGLHIGNIFHNTLAYIALLYRLVQDS